MASNTRAKARASQARDRGLAGLVRLDKLINRIKKGIEGSQQQLDGLLESRALAEERLAKAMETLEEIRLQEEVAVLEVPDES